MHRERCLILENKEAAPHHFVMRFKSEKIAEKAAPGQFVQIMCGDSLDPLLPRPFSFLDAGNGEFSFLYHAVGKGTNILAKIKKGESLWVTGPLGVGFTVDADRTWSALLVGGGVGIPPLYHLAKIMAAKSKAAAKNIHVFLGARNKSLLLCENEFNQLGVTLHISTDDGSKGEKGLVTKVLTAHLNRTTSEKPDRTWSVIYTCGPTPMLKAVSGVATEYNVPCEISVEVPMACGFGACLGCAIKVRSQEAGDRSQETGGRSQESHRFAIACCEGPVFKKNEIIWE